MTTYHVSIGIGKDLCFKKTTSKKNAQKIADETDGPAVVNKFVKYDELMPIVYMNETALEMHKSGEHRWGNLHLGEW